MKTSYIKLVSKINNAVKSQNKSFTTNLNTSDLEVLKFLYKEKAIYSFKRINRSTYEVFVKDQVLFKPLAKPSRSFFLAYKDLCKLKYGTKSLVVSTNKGLKNLKSCLEEKKGGLLSILIS